jgi:hypothetical protein
MGGWQNCYKIYTSKIYTLFRLHLDQGVINIGLDNW